MKHAIRGPDDIAGLKFDADGLVPVIAQDEASGAVLMLAWANAEALQRSLDTGLMTYWSRSRARLWQKGEESGQVQHVVVLAADCDQDAVLAVVDQEGPACHEGTGTCWTHREETPVATYLGVLDRLAAERKAKPQGRYTDQLLADPTFAAKKVVEEAREVASVLKGEETEDPLPHEAADVLYHLVVALRGADSDLMSALAELRGRDRQR